MSGLIQLMSSVPALTAPRRRESSRGSQWAMSGIKVTAHIRGCARRLKHDRLGPNLVQSWSIWATTVTRGHPLMHSGER